jgi:hypothetical protein
VQFESMTVAFEQHRVIASLEDMAPLPAPPVDPLAVAAVQVLHSGSQVGLGRFDEQVVVGAQQAVRTAEPSPRRDHVPDDVEEACAILVVSKQ